MTTIDFDAECDSDRRFSLHGGLGGPAAVALNLLADAIRAGVVEGEFGVEITAGHVRGDVLKKILAPMAGAERWASPLVTNHPLFRNGDELLAHVDESADYNLAALEV